MVVVTRCFASAQQEVCRVTVCIAARSGSNVIGASDRMLTSGDIQFEPSLISKFTQITTSLGILQAGDAAFHSEIMWGVVAEVQERITAHPQDWWLASDISDLYVKHRTAIKRKRAQAAILSPLGLTIEGFLTNQNQFKDDIADQITRDIINYEVPDVSVLVVGIDPKGPHIYVVDNGEISCNDVIGFAAIGIGARHAESQFMLGKHSWQLPLADTALLTYAAKKRSEIAPGVGKATDMFTAGPGLGSLEVVGQDVVDRLDTAYRRMKRREERCQQDAQKEVNAYVQEREARYRATLEQQTVPRREHDGEGATNSGEAGPAISTQKA